MTTPDLTVEQARRIVRDQQELIKLHTIWLLLGAAPLCESQRLLAQRTKEQQA